MYFYLYDASLAESKYYRQLADIETRLTDLGLQGRTGRLSPLKSATELIKNALKGGAKTIVAVGNDQTVALAINAMVPLGTGSIALGIIPIGKPSNVATMLGIPGGLGAVTVLAARKTEVVDLGKINNHYFLTSARLQASDSLALRCEDSYTLRPLDPRSALIIANLGIGTNCQDGYLEATIESGGRGWWGRKKRSVVPLRHGTILAANASTGTAVAENAYTIKLPATIEVIPKMLKMIVGRERAF
ncbi:hypothetical protein A3H10_00925 [Candidatus Uhrbacteria bacterium RIFCSPLOWO2_12_FULL_46_10]|uniref:DAGKc domain-containing protein n=1 Tax=Candidatus Uhrbacteria bacterium RIFCSPLOWO2_01_FULL_47_25 TaxID=1802402 RepID=A0A1F7US27_9BACT|nr:MAG: hypothetical protein A2752_01190 [Candidatus Uhrbacteria bacterium RIFCSPHIGHO2_01_FULL_46_23]OGL68486.1 MAG: hypothetical protein A3D60_02625 [Candidatus Uhrbacteria bacterium RIFCSPHIGHO2_02_FULL_47_29]OGL75587.1 MAG: hypothetical protein A3E96_00910 [Candidatus Uhrbacteria bacterium RIFCSPHIGHO2_12_FULL_46_13]OGL81102.1 MAG: hypothetical protein A2936_00675 [Candidatus Uhrbacteria bacterium RIFCSPLOWO2_01_FULL_47_25]OGL86415.1 MAG: hypothetical protein A3I37_01950 [Candidatus Uhrbact